MWEKMLFGQETGQQPQRNGILQRIHNFKCVIENLITVLENN